MGECYSGSDRATSDLNQVDETTKRLLELAIVKARSIVDAKNGPHPIQYGAAVVFGDGTIATSHQSSALVYSCTLDAVSQLVGHIQESSSVPFLLMQVDQHGIAPAPFAPARSYLTEHGHGECHILLHETLPTNQVVHVTTVNDRALKSVPAAELAPNAPAWTVSTDR